MHDQDRMLRATEVAELLQLPLTSVWGLARTGALPCITIGRLRRFPRGAILAIAKGELLSPATARPPAPDPGHGAA